ncbi:MAG TPA: cytoplasmic protein [Nitrospinota bacterium]|nr:cytoplasmic protein [Nitrospinota bacterium]
MQHREFKKFQASSLYCPKCRRATEVRERLLLVLPDGDLFDYSCSLCGTSVGKKKDSQTESKKIVLTTS